MVAGAVDPSRIAHLSGAFTPVTAEVDAVDLPVDGELPRELDGLFLRNGPNPRFTPIGSYLYPLDGDAMVHGVWLNDGRAHYRNRFVRTPGLAAEERAGRALWGGVTSLPAPGLAEFRAATGPKAKDRPNGGVIRHAGRLLALAESAPPFRLSAGLETVGRETFAGALPDGLGAHPRIDPDTGELIAVRASAEPPYLTWFTLDPLGGVGRPPTPVDGVDRPVLVHDLAITSRYLVLLLAPCRLSPALAWLADRPTGFALVPRDGGPVRWAQDDEAFWSWHTVNAHDEPDGTVALSYVRWSRPALEDGDVAPNRCALMSTRIGPDGTLRHEQRDDRPVEFPRIDDRRTGRPHQITVLGAQTGRRELPRGEYDALRWYAADWTSTQWDAGDLSVSEAVFAPSPGAPDESHGHWLAYATDRTDGRSELLVIPAQDPAAGPLARVRLPSRVPLGQHASWLPTSR